jgi:hypothetical protein
VILAEALQREQCLTSMSLVFVVGSVLSNAGRGFDLLVDRD